MDPITLRAENLAVFVGAIVPPRFAVLTAIENVPLGTSGVIIEDVVRQADGSVEVISWAETDMFSIVVAANLNITVQVCQK